MAVSQSKVEIYPGTVHLRRYLSLKDQQILTAKCAEIGQHNAGFYVPVVRGGAYMKIQMVCLGLHWNARTYGYESVRSDYDNLPVQELPEELKQIARHAAAEATMTIEPDLCILNYYTESGRLGLHQDKEEKTETLEAGIPVVSISLGDTAVFMMGGHARKEPIKRFLLESGDALVFGGPSRLRFHGVARVLTGTSPKGLGMTGRYNLTFRQY
jgi:DNA alkylation damage repair protein AlkB